MLIRQTALYLPAQLLGPLAQLAAIVLWTHWLDPDAFGLFTLALAAQEAVYLLLLSFWTFFLLRFLPGASAALRQRMDAVEVPLFLANALVQSIVLLALMRYLMHEWPSRELLGVLFAFTFTRSYCSHLADRARADGAIGTYTLLQTIGPAGGLLIGWTWAGLAPVGPLQVLGAYAIAQAIALLLALPHLRIHPRLRAPEAETLRHAYRYGLPLAASSLLAWVAGNGNRFVVEHALGIAAAGMFSVGWSLGQRACSFAAMLVTAAAFPLALRLDASESRDRAMHQLALNGALLCSVLLPTVAGLILLMPVLTGVMVSQPYVATTLEILPLAALTGLIKNLRSHFANQAFLLAQKTGWTLALDILETLLFLIGAAVGLRFLGLTGAAWGALVAVSVGALLAFAIAMSRLGMPFPGAHLLRIVLATAAMSAVLYAMPALSGWKQLLAAVALGGAVYTSVLAVSYREHLGKLRTL